MKKSNKTFTREEIIDIITPLIKEKYPDYQKGDTESHPENDFGWDSLDAIEFIMECEKEFQIPITDEEMDSVFSNEKPIDTLISLIITKTSDK